MSIEEKKLKSSVIHELTLKGDFEFTEDWVKYSDHLEEVEQLKKDKKFLSDWSDAKTALIEVQEKEIKELKEGLKLYDNYAQLNPFDKELEEERREAWDRLVEWRKKTKR